MRKTSVLISVTAVCAAALLSCGGPSKARRLQRDDVRAGLELAASDDIPELEYRQLRRDTIVVRDDATGRDILIMKAVRDDQTGEMVANDVLQAAVVTARFRNIAERGGKVDLRFQITVPAKMRDSKWQLRFYPDMYIQGDSVRLDPVYVTGRDYRRGQLRGYEQYNRWLSRIISDTTRLIDRTQFERFLERNIPEVFALRTDSSLVSDGQFAARFGRVTERQALDHYTLWSRVRRNGRRLAARDRMYARLVKSPIVTEGIRLDTVLVDRNGDYVYHYVQTVNTRPRLRKVDIVLSGDIWDRDRRVYVMPRTEPLTFYISSVSAFADMSERYLTRVVGRRVEANASYRIAFDLGKDRIRPELGDNAAQIAHVKDNLADLMANEVFDLDSIVVVAHASPEGSWALNEGLSRRRGQSVTRYFRDYMAGYRGRLDREGFSVDESGSVSRRSERAPEIRFVSRSVPENWILLDRLVLEDSRLDDGQKRRYFSRAVIKDMDRRERLMSGDDYYAYVRDTLYPRLRVVDFAFHLHRKGMVQDTVRTTELDERYMEGVRLLRDMDYDGAVRILGPYQDFNAAVAYTGAMRDASAMVILEGLEPDARINYLKAIIHARLGDEQKAVQCYLDACREDPSYVHRGNLDPEISGLIRLYALNGKDTYDDTLGY